MSLTIQSNPSIRPSPVCALHATMRQWRLAMAGRSSTCCDRGEQGDGDERLEEINEMDGCRATALKAMTEQVVQTGHRRGGGEAGAPRFICYLMTRAWCAG